MTDALPSGAMLGTRGLTVRYPGSETPVLEALDLAIQPGAVTALVGASGSGKSTLALALLGLLPGEAVAAGTLSWHGGPLDHAALRGRSIGFVPQDCAAALNPLVTVGRQVEEAILAPLSRAERRSRALDLLAAAQLDEPTSIAARYPHQLSGGQCQRAVIACATANGPELLIADEPTSALDPLTAHEVLGLLVRLTREDCAARPRGTPGGLLLVSHDLAAVGLWADRVLVMDRGRVVEDGPPRALLRHPRSEAARRLVAAARPDRAVLRAA